MRKPYLAVMLSGLLAVNAAFSSFAAVDGTKNTVESGEMDPGNPDGDKKNSVDSDEKKNDPENPEGEGENQENPEGEGENQENPEGEGENQENSDGEGENSENLKRKKRIRRELTKTAVKMIQL